MPDNEKGRPGCSNTWQAANDNHIMHDEYNDPGAAAQSRVASLYMRRGIPGNLARLFACIFCSEVCSHD